MTTAIQAAQVASPFFDGHMVDIITLAIGFLSIPVGWLRRWRQKIPVFSRWDSVLDFLTGVVLVPFALLVGSVVSSWMMAELLRTNKVFIAIAGGVGLIFAIGELLNPGGYKTALGDSNRIRPPTP